MLKIRKRSRKDKDYYTPWTAAEIQPLIELYESGKTLREVGEIYHLSRERVRKLFQKVGYKPRRMTRSKLFLETQKKRGLACRKILPKAKLEKMYREEKLSIKQIAEKLGTTKQIVYLNLVRYNIPKRSREEVARLFLTKNPELTKEKLFNLYITENKTRLEIAVQFGYSVSGVAWILKRYNIRKITGEEYESHYGKLKRFPEECSTQARSALTKRRSVQQVMVKADTR